MLQGKHPVTGRFLALLFKISYLNEYETHQILFGIVQSKPFIFRRHYKIFWNSRYKQISDTPGHLRGPYPQKITKLKKIAYNEVADDLATCVKGVYEGLNRTTIHKCLTSCLQKIALLKSFNFATCKRSNSQRF